MKTSYIQYKWICLLLFVFLWTMPSAALAQEPKLTAIQKQQLQQCVSKVTKDMIQKNKNGPDFAAALDATRAYCRYDKMNAEESYTAKLLPVIMNMAYPVVGKTCFPSVNDEQRPIILQYLAPIIIPIFSLETMLFIRQQEPICP